MSAPAPRSLDELAPQLVAPLGVPDPAVLRSWTEAAGQRYCEVELGACRDCGTALRAIGRGLDLPEWYGANLDALYDCLAELAESMHGSGLMLVLRGFTRIAEVDRDRHEALLDVFRDAAEVFAQQGASLRVLYD